MSPRFAPIAFRIPISFVLSVTVTSIMFMTTMPPTSREISVIGVTTAAIAPVNRPTPSCIALLARMSKSSSWFGFNLWRDLMITLTSSCVVSSASDDGAFIRKVMDWRVPYFFKYAV